MRRAVRTSQVAALAFTLSLGLGACSGSQEAVEEPVAAEDEATEETAETDTTAADEADVAEIAETTDDADVAGEGLGAGFDMAATAAPAPSVGLTTPTTGRVVRYITTNDTAIFAEPKDGAATVAKMKKGDRVIVSEEGAWARISDGMFVKADQLSVKAVARDRQNAVWQKKAAH